MQERERLGYLDGLKAVAAVLVFHIHFLNAYYCGIYTLNPQDFHTKSGMEWWIGATPLNLIYAGKAGARIFLAVSAFLLAYGYFKNYSAGKLFVMPLKKYIRLAPAVLVANLLVFVLMRLGAYHNAAAAVLAGSWEHFGVYNQFEPDLAAAAWEALVGCFLTGSNRYNGPIWFMQYEFLGCILSAGLLLIVGKRRMPVRFGTYVLTALLLIRTDYLCMILSVAASDLVWIEKKQHCQEKIEEWTQKLIKGLTEKNWLLWILLAASLYFLTYPSMGKTEGTIYALFSAKVLFYYNAAIPVLLFCLIYLKPLHRMLDRKLFIRFNRIAYFFYLVHFPLLATLSAAFFQAMYARVNYHVLCLFTYLLTFTASVLLAWLLTKWVDRPVQRLAAYIEEKLLCRK